MDNQLVHANNDGTLTTTSEIIAGGVGIQHKNVLETIRKNQADFEEFGRVAFETRTRQTAGGAQKTNIAVLNREQAMFAMTLFRNTPVVVDFCQMRVFGTGVLGTRYCRVPGSWYRAEGYVGPGR